MTDTASEEANKLDHLVSIQEVKYFDRSLQITTGAFVSKVVLGLVSGDGKKAKAEFAFAMPTPELLNLAMQVLELSARPETKRLFKEALEQYNTQLDGTHVEMTSAPEK